MARRIIEEREYYDKDDRYRERLIDPDVPRRRRRSRYAFREWRRPSALPIFLLLLLVGAIAAGVYFYYYGNRSLGSDIGQLRDTSESAATTAAVKTAFSLNKNLNDDNIDVDSDNGVVTLNGVVNSAEDKQLAEQVARNTRGVHNVVNNIAITEEGQNLQRVRDLESQSKDLEVHNKVLEALLANDELKGQDIKVKVVDQIVTLTGAVDTQQQKNVASGIAKNIDGVREVKDSDLKVRYEQAAEPSPDLPLR